MVTAADIAREIGNDAELKRRSKVVAFTDLPGVPEGTAGKVSLVNGWDTWVRYRVIFDNGVELGSINRPHLAPAKKYGEFKQLRTTAIESGAFDEAETDSADAGAGDGGGESGGGITINGVTVPQRLLDLSKAARERLGA